MKTTFQACRLQMENVKPWASTSLSSYPFVCGKWLHFWGFRMGLVLSSLEPRHIWVKCPLRRVPGNSPFSLKSWSQLFYFFFTFSPNLGVVNIRPYHFSWGKEAEMSSHVHILGHVSCQRWISVGPFTVPALWGRSFRRDECGQSFTVSWESVAVPIGLDSG